MSAKLTIEHFGNEGWRAEVDVNMGGPGRMRIAHAAVFEDIMAAATEAYRDMVPLPLSELMARPAPTQRDPLPATRRGQRAAIRT